MPVGFRHFGRMGNFLYQAAAAYGYSKKYELELVVPSTTNNAKWNPLYLQHMVNPSFEQNKENILLNENGHHYQLLPFKEDWRNQYIVLNGYYQSYKYFDFCREEMIKDFGFPYEINEGVVSVHVRRGDYLLYPTKHPVVTPVFLISAMKKIVEKGYNKFYFFSDDNYWVKEFFNDVSIHFGNDVELAIHEGDEVDALIKMSCCEHNICSNSTLSVWAAELNQNPNKIVILPHENNWFGKDNKHLNICDLYRPEWIQIKY